MDLLIYTFQAFNEVFNYLIGAEFFLVTLACTVPFGAAALLKMLLFKEN